MEEPLTDLEDQPCLRPLPRLEPYAPQTSFLKGDANIDIGLTGALAAQHTAYDCSVGPLVLPYTATDPDEAKIENLVSLVSVECQEEDTSSESHELTGPEVPAPWSMIPLSERDVVLNALQAQCHPIECLAGERYWIQTPSPMDIDTTRKCRNCGAAKRDISKDPAESVCRFHPAKKAFQQGIIRGRGRGAQKKARCFNCKQPGRSKGCIIFSAHAFAAPDEKLGNMARTPAYKRGARKAIVLDCEMVGVLGASGREHSEVVRLSAVDFLSGEVIIDTYVSPQGLVISWRTKFSGVNASVLAEKEQEGKSIMGWQAARDLLWQFIDAQTVLIGHSLNNDLAVLGMVHTRIVDSAIITRLAVGEDCRRQWALKTLVRQFLDRDIQAGNDGHDCVEDTYATREVVLWCVRNASKLQAWAAGERRIIAEKHTKKVLVTEAIEVASAK
ncbi:ribonuclease H-like domain-containing protein [Aspergillus floccosus]